VNHLEGHVHAVFLEAHREQRTPELPAVCLIVSGGHTILYEVHGEPLPGGNGYAVPAQRFFYRRLGQTRDDAAGEAYDKVAKLLALGYPGGPVIDQLAAHGHAGAVRFTPPVTKGNPFDFSFSGIKTAVLRFVRSHPQMEQEIAERRAALARGERKAEQLLPLCSRETLGLIASFQRSVVQDLVTRTLAAAENCAAGTILVSGGVAANGELRRSFQDETRQQGGSVFFPSRLLSTDNAAMIAAAAYPRLVAGEIAGMQLDAAASLPLS
jgi:N6-L-threonylcarbamoyladenine synthase